jgi:hypothetical protein
MSNLGSRAWGRDTAQVTRTYPPWLLGARLLGTAALVGGLFVTLQRTGAPGWLGPALIGAFLLLRVGSEWALALLHPDAEGRHRRSAILNTLIAAAVVAFWFYIRRRGLSP